jgi:hypothetical protein
MNLLNVIGVVSSVVSHSRTGCGRANQNRAKSATFLHVADLSSFWLARYILLHLYRSRLTTMSHSGDGTTHAARPSCAHFS